MWTLFNNDWHLMHAARGVWNIKNTSGHEYDKECWYEVWYSKSRNRCRIKVGGYQPKCHSMYSAVVENMNKWMQEINETKHEVDKQ